MIYMIRYDDDPPPLLVKVSTLEEHGDPTSLVETLKGIGFVEVDQATYALEERVMVDFGEEDYPDADGPV